MVSIDARTADLHSGLPMSASRWLPILSHLNAKAKTSIIMVTLVVDPFPLVQWQTSRFIANSSQWTCAGLAGDSSAD